MCQQFFSFTTGTIFVIYICAKFQVKNHEHEVKLIFYSTQCDDMVQQKGLSKFEIAPASAVDAE